MNRADAVSSTQNRKPDRRQAMQALGLAALAAAASLVKTTIANAETQPAGIPKFQVDPMWPKPSGHFGDNGNWIYGAIGGITVNPANDHVWLFQRPETLNSDELFAAHMPPIASCCVSAPPVMEFDSAGNYLRGWGGPGPGYDWPKREHGIRIDYSGNVWLTGAGKGDNQILKFTQDGKFLLQIGHPNQSRGDSDTENLNEPTNIYVRQKSNEVFVSDGYINRRVIVYDAESGEFKRMWGAYGHRPSDSYPRIDRFPFSGPQYLPLESLTKNPPPQQFNLVHDILISNDDLVYVADRSNNRIQVFKPEGTFVKEAFVERDLLTPVGTVVSLAFSPDSGQRFIYVVSGDECIRILDRPSLRVLGKFGRLGHLPGQFFQAHGIATDSKGNIYDAAAGNTGRRAQKFVLQN